MSLMELLGDQLRGDNLSSLSRLLGTDDGQTGSAVQAALPILMGALSRNTQSPEGAEALSRALSKDHDGSILDNLGGFLGAGNDGPGQAILGHVLGGKQKRIETGISKMSGMDPGAAGKLLAVLAPVVLGALGRQKREKGLDGAGLAGLLQSERSEGDRGLPTEMGLVNRLLDSDGDGDVDLGDLARGAGKLGKLFGGR